MNTHVTRRYLASRTQNSRRYSKQYYPHADTLVDYLGNFTLEHGLNIRYNTRVVSVQRDGNRRFSLLSADGEVIRGKTVVVATGLFVENLPPLQGSELIWS